MIGNHLNIVYGIKKDCSNAECVFKLGKCNRDFACSMVNTICRIGSIPNIFILQRRADTSLQVILNTVFLLFQSLGRLIVMPLCGGILFFQGWRLDPLLQFGISLLVFLVIIESFSGILADYQKWRSRAGGVAANTSDKH